MSTTTNSTQLVPHTTPAAGRLGQATAVEQSRAVAEVQAAIVVAQQCPRNVPLAIDMMRESCRRRELAEKAFFSYRRGTGTVTGPSIHLARELARCWGNIQYGLRELRRDDEASEMLAFAWDVQTNARCDNIVINPHRRYSNNAELTDLRDVYENNANVGARRVREAIFAVLPAWYTEEAEAICNETLQKGDGKPLGQQIADAITAFGNMGITLSQIEARLGPSGKWNERDVAQLRVTHKSITRGEISKEEAFPQERTTLAELTGDAPAQPQRTAQEAAPAPAESQEPAPEPEAAAEPAPAPQQPGAPKATRASLGRMLARLPLGPAADRQEFLAWRAGRPEARALADLTPAEVESVSAWLENLLASERGDTEAAASSAWSMYRDEHPQDAPDGGQ